MYNLPPQQKLLKLAMYSACQITDCRCSGWKTPEESRHRDVESDYCPQFTTQCRNCYHPVNDHISHLDSITDEQVNELLGAIVDVENLFMSMHREQDEDTKKVYYFLFRVSQIKKIRITLGIKITKLVLFSFLSFFGNVF